MLINVLILFLAFCTMWLASELVVQSMTRFAHRLNMSSFAVSFFVLGLLTSLPEISIGISATLENKPDIFIGNLIGGSVVIFLLVIPLLAIFGNGINISHALPHRHLLLALFVILLPAFFTLNGRIHWQESIIMLGMYGLLFYFIRKHKGVVETVEDIIHPPAEGNKNDLLKVLCGITLIFSASKALVYVIPLLAASIGIPSFLVSLVFLSIGTNLPELFIAIHAVLNHDKGVALGDYIGSAAANTLTLSLLVLINIALKNPIIVNAGEFVITFIIFAVGLVLFYFMARSKDEISRKEGAVLFLVYIIFLLSEIMISQ